MIIPVIPWKKQTGKVHSTDSPAAEAVLKDLELQGMHRSFDEMVCVEHKYNAGKAEQLCAAIKRYMVEAATTKSEKEKVRDITVQNLINWGVVKNMDGSLLPTNAFVLLTDHVFPFAKIQCALFKGTERVVFIDKRDFEGPLYEQIEEGGSKIRNRCIAEVFSRMRIKVRQKVRQMI